MKTIKTSLTISNATDDRGRQIVDLLKQYVNGFNVYYGFKNFGDNTEDIAFPAVFVDPSETPDMIKTTGKTMVERTFDIVFVVIDNDLSDCLTLSTSGMEAILKLFSNNALGDYSGAHTQRFMNNNPFWAYSEIRMAKLMKPFLNPGPSDKESRWCRVGWVKFWTQDLKLK